ncbi:MAG: hypothetical protein A3B81_03925 [Candidatus Muproteobacteria bacterium RIFCSPHIGHO2_02_FULL_65_16]|uniref:Uncharacterized protein n=1 Tax=Candidatus Muproteobacteria bacterium RIFCSPHIGHO2_02_FULL_65_16 TaxID=1817766 RepID=A0A1F6TWA5_9PROT|nr:MAG: hypothetical protein A3B81_03925 [Candidatus Muproteobacteria bacterium RIFCSPHIGHO2_02_FULL_65_16]
MEDGEKINLFEAALGKLIPVLDAHGVDYAFMPARTSAALLLHNDLDVYVADISQSTKALKSFVKKEADIDAIWGKDHATGRRFSLLCRNKNSEYALFPGPDLVIFPTMKGNIAFRIQDAVKRAKKDADGKRVLKEEDAFLLYAVKSIEKGRLGLAEKQYLANLYQHASEAVEKRLHEVLGPSLASLIAGEVMHNKDNNVELLETLRAELYIRNAKRLSKYWWNLSRSLKRALFPSGLFVALLGPDGCGKSSVIGRLLPAVRGILASSAQETFHLRPALGRRKDGEAKPVIDPHGRPPRNIFSSIAKIGYFFFDYVLGYFFVIRPKLVRSTFVVFDRYYHDLLVDPKRYRYGGPMWLARWVGKLIPKPDLFVLLDAPPEVLQSRKKEVPFEETSRQRAAYLQLVRGMKNGVVIDASRSLDQVVAEVEKVILNSLVERTRRRLKLA